MEVDMNGFRNGRGQGRRGQLLFEGYILLLLKEKPSHGYELAKQLTDLGIHLPGIGAMGNLYRILAVYEENDFISSAWKTEATGPAKKEYRLTEKGETELRFISESLTTLRDRIDDFLKKYKDVKK
jgi:DNA-binding PadR family transcriptional regulator